MILFGREFKSVLLRESILFMIIFSLFILECHIPEPRSGDGLKNVVFIYFPLYNVIEAILFACYCYTNKEDKDSSIGSSNILKILVIALGPSLLFVLLILFVFLLLR
jgi:hypothetical protein